MRTPRAPHGARPVGRIPKEYEEDKEDEKMRDSKQRVEFPVRVGPHDVSCSRAGLHTGRRELEERSTVVGIFSFLIVGGNIYFAGS